MEDSFDPHQIDVTSPMMETALEAHSPSASLNSTTKSLSTSSSTRSLQSKSSSREEIDCIPESSALMTTGSGTPPRPKNLPARLQGASGGPVDGLRDGATRHNSLRVGTCVSVTVEETQEERLRAPIVGYEIMEQRAKFTVFKIHVRRSDRDNWLIFRRYTDFVRVNDKLKEIFPIFRLSLPPKRWFGSNFDQNFLEDRQLGLQAFIDNIIGHKEVVLSGPVREFLCLDDPPGPHDNLEESRALCESLDETVYNLRKELAERDKRISLLNTELEEAHQHIALLNQHLLNESISVTNTDTSSTPVSGESSTIEGDIRSQSEADQSMSLAQSEDHRPMSRHSASSPRTASSPCTASLPPITESRSQVTVKVTTRSDQHLESRRDTDEEPSSSRSDVITVT